MLGSMVGTGDTGEKKVVCALSVLGHLDVLGILAHLKGTQAVHTHRKASDPDWRSFPEQRTLAMNFESWIEGDQVMDWREGQLRPRTRHVLVQCS